MSAQVYPGYTYERAPQQQNPQAGPSRRNPLANLIARTNNAQPAANIPTTLPAVAATPKKQATPPLARQKPKTPPPSPPQIISDSTGELQYQRIGFLGEGGFARVYEVRDARGKRVACKVVTKASLKTKKAKTKLYAEIKIHKSLEHPNIVDFLDCFEDSENVYMTLGLCHTGSLMDMLRRRRRFTEPESRFFMVQLIGACHYMHNHQVIHRDLKLGNIFLDGRMNVKVGDFGLAALIESEGERKKTICGTPNYIAPEVLFDTANGHSFEVDTWSIGVILYTLVVGRPPFQTKDVKEIYQRIRANDYAFPTDRHVSSAAKELVAVILTQDPSQRPSLHEIIDHVFFTESTFPSFIPTSAYDTAPDFRNVTRAASKANYETVRRKALLDEEEEDEMEEDVPERLPSSKTATSSIAQQEKEFQKAVQPGSPISALLSSAKQPLMRSNGTANGGNPRDSPLFRKLQAASHAKSPLGPGAKAAMGRAAGRGLHDIAESEDRNPEILERRKQLEAQKARIVAQMAPEEKEDVVMAFDKAKQRVHAIESIPKAPSSNVGGRENQAPMQRKDAAKEVTKAPVLGQSTAEPTAGVKLNSFDAAAKVLTLAFDAKALGKVFRDPRQDPRAPLTAEKVFIASWVDYCNKYGMAYALTDGSVGVHFNDSTTLILSADKVHFDFISSRKAGTIPVPVYVRKCYTVEKFPDELKSKVYLLKHFERYIMDRLWGKQDFTFEDVERTKGMDWVQKYLRMKHVIVFKLSHDVLQFNFYDHTKLILSSHGLVVTYIDKNYKISRFTLNEIMSLSLKTDLDPETAKLNGRLIDKLKYCKEVLVSIHTASGSSDENQGPPLGVSTTSKASVR